MERERKGKKIEGNATLREWSSLTSLLSFSNLFYILAQVEQIEQLIEEGKNKSQELNVTLKSLEHATNRIQVQYSKAQNEIADTYQFYLSLLEDTKAETQKELDDIYNSKLVSLTLLNSKVHDAIDKMAQLDLFTDRLRRVQSPTELAFFKHLIESRLRALASFDTELNEPNSIDIEFVSNFQTIRVSFLSS